eukprot:scaffold4305_cov370-Prasinococcus_capsulatus_cf.AAC.1
MSAALCGLVALLWLGTSGAELVRGSIDDVSAWNALLPEGSIEDAQCDMESVQKANSEQLHTILAQLTNTTFFRLFQVDLDTPCPLLHDEDEAEFECGGTSSDEGDAEPLCGLEGTGDPWAGPFGTTNEVDRTISHQEDVAIHSIIECNDPSYWLDICEAITVNSSEYLNLALNPERWTGYNGTQVWDAIYLQNCFSDVAGFDNMCYEERVLYRLLSGMHSSINTHIALKYFPPRKGHRTDWEKNPGLFMQQVGSHPDRMQNLHFSFVVMLRALSKISPFLYNFPFRVGDTDPDEQLTKALVQRLIDSKLLSSCQQVFDAFDESLMFRMPATDDGMASLKSQFKEVFHNISGILDCVSCQKCKLHGKLQLLGLGTALKILLSPVDVVVTVLSRNDLVALVNTIAKFSSAIQGAKALAIEYWKQNLLYSSFVDNEKDKDVAGSVDIVVSQPLESFDVSSSKGTALMDTALEMTSKLAARGLISLEDEENLVASILARDAGTLLLAKHYYDNPSRFAQFATLSDPPAGTRGAAYDGVIIGGGLAGLACALELLDAGARIALIDKQGVFGGNSAKASSGINGVDAVDAQNRPNEDSVESFLEDCINGGGLSGNGIPGGNHLLPTLARRSVDTLEWVRKRGKIALDLVGQLGGHSFPRTHRPKDGLAGSEIVVALEKQLKPFKETGQLTVMKNTKATSLMLEDGRVTGIRVENTKDPADNREVLSANVVLATGGYASDFADNSLLDQYRPDLRRFATTNGKFSTGDGHKMAASIGASMVDMEHVQVHPTGFIDPEDPTSSVKTLCAEILRGVGGIMLTRNGQRFVNELGTRDYVSGRMLEVDPEGADFVLLLSDEMAEEAAKHIGLYSSKGLMSHFDTLEDVAEFLSDGGNVTAATLAATILGYNRDALGGGDPFGKQVFNHVPIDATRGFWAGHVTPVIHYTMGGVAVDSVGRVVRDDGGVIGGLYAAGEIVGGLHGKNRLGGNALTEAAVFGRVVAEQIMAGLERRSRETPEPTKAAVAPTLRAVTLEELSTHGSPDDCWLAIDGQVYDFTHFLEDHPAGVEAILQFGGADGTDGFLAVHSLSLLDEFEPVGLLATDGA